MKMIRSRNFLLVALILPFLLAVSASTVDLHADMGRGEYRPGELVCEMLPGYSIELVNAAYGTTIRGHQPQTNCYLLSTPSGADAESLAVLIDAMPEVLYCGLNFYFDTPEGLQRSQPFLDVYGDGDYETQEAALALELPVLRTLSTGEGVGIALLDGGVNFDHPLFSGDSGVISVWDYVDGDTEAFDEPGGGGSGHGTFVAGVLRLMAPGASICVYRVLDTAGRGTGYDVASALLDAVDRGCKVANLSLGMNGVDDAVDEALRYARDHNVMVIASAGNDSTDDSYLFPFPASRTNCVAVAALDSLNRKADFSNFGIKIDYDAPGTHIYGPYLDTSYAWWDGTSFSAPFVSALAGLVYSVDPSLSVTAVDTLLALTAINVDSLNPGLEGLLGHGRINPVGLMQLLTPETAGDVNLDGEITTDDVIFLVNYIFKGGICPTILSSADANCDGTITAADIIYLIRFIFSSGPPPCDV